MAVKTIRIRMSKLAASAEGILKEGEEYDVEPGKARDLIQARAAVLVNGDDIRHLQTATRGSDRETARTLAGKGRETTGPEKLDLEAAPFARGENPQHAPAPAAKPPTRAERRAAARSAAGGEPKPS